MEHLVGPRRNCGAYLAFKSCLKYRQRDQPLYLHTDLWILTVCGGEHEVSQERALWQCQEQFLSKDLTVRHQQLIILEEGLEGKTHYSPLWWSPDPFASYRTSSWRTAFPSKTSIHDMIYAHLILEKLTISLHSNYTRFTLSSASMFAS